MNLYGVEQSKKYATGLRKELEFLSKNPNHGKRYLATGKKMLFRYRYIAYDFLLPNRIWNFYCKSARRKNEFFETHDIGYFFIKKKDYAKLAETVGRELLSSNISLFFHLLIVLSETPYLRVRSLFESLLLLISQRNRTFVTALE